MSKLRVFEAFAGIGTQRMALNRLGVEHEVIGMAEIDKYAIKSYEAIHGETYNVGDISKVESKDIPDHDLFTYSFPCQDISVAGNQKGLDENSGTRSSLLWECNRVIETVRPKYLLMENVKNLVGKKHKPNFDKWLDHLENLGYKNYWKVLNSKDYGVGQSRERLFCVSILGGDTFAFPDKIDQPCTLACHIDHPIEDSEYLVPREILQSYYDKKGAFGKRFSIKEPDDFACTLVAKSGRAVITNNYICDHPLVENKGKAAEKEILDNHFKVRTLSPSEYWSLTGIDNSDFEKAQEVNSNSQLYKQAGNAIVVDVLYHIFRQLLTDDLDRQEGIKLF